ncbi:hypothetical protein GCM10027347_60530 [Larkinella harenae]
MKRIVLVGSMLPLLLGCSTRPNAPEHICAVYLQCINAKQWDLASRYVVNANPSMLQLTPLLTKNYRFQRFRWTKTEYAQDSSRVRVHSTLTYADDTYLDSVFLLEKDPLTGWKIRSL